MIPISIDNNILKEFVKLTNDNNDKKQTENMYGTIVVKDGISYVKIDGSDISTPIRTTTDVKENERVIVTIKNHMAVVTGNLTDPSASGDRVTETEDKVNDVYHRLESAEGLITEVRITTDGLTAKVTGLDGKYTELKQTVDGFDITGMVTFNDLSNPGSTTIHGGNIKTGTVSGDTIRGGLLDGVQIKVDGGAMMTKYNFAGMYLSCAGFVVDSGSSEAIIDCGRLDVMKDQFSNSGIVGLASGLAVSGSGSVSVGKDMYANKFLSRYNLSVFNTKNLLAPNIDNLNAVVVNNSYKIQVNGQYGKSSNPYLNYDDEHGIGLDLESVIASLLSSVKELKEENKILKEQIGGIQNEK